MTYDRSTKHITKSIEARKSRIDKQIRPSTTKVVFKVSVHQSAMTGIASLPFTFLRINSLTAIVISCTMAVSGLPIRGIAFHSPEYYDEELEADQPCTRQHTLRAELLGSILSHPISRQR